MRTILLLVFAGFFISCEKESIPTIEGKWDIDKSTYKEYYDGKLVFSQEHERSGETIEFRADGQVEITDQSGKRLSPYTISGENISFLGMTYQIQNLSESSVTLLDHHVHGVGEYHDTYLHLVRID